MNRKSYAVLPAALMLTAGIVMLSDAASAQRAPGKQRPTTGLLPTDTRMPSRVSPSEGGLAGISFTENFEGFAPGAGCNQNGWTGFCGDDGTGQPVFEIDVPTAASMGALTAFHNSDGSGAFAFDIISPIFTLETGRIDADILISDANTLYQLVTINNGSGFFNTRVHFELDGTIQALQVTDPACTTGVFSPTTGTWTGGTKMRIGVETDGTTLNIYKDNALIFTGTDINSFCGAGGPVGIDQLAVFSDNVNGDSSMQTDNIASGGGAPCLEDTNGDGAVDVDDLIAVILAWGTADPDADVNNDGTVDVDDLIAVILAWGPC